MQLITIKVSYESHTHPDHTFEMRYLTHRPLNNALKLISEAHLGAFQRQQPRMRPGTQLVQRLVSVQQLMLSEPLSQDVLLNFNLTEI